MSFEKVSNYLKSQNLSDRILVFDSSSATVELAAQAVGCKPERIAKSLTFLVNEKPIMIVTAGDAKIDNSKFKAQFQTKAKMLSPDEVQTLVGHTVGGVCPFAVNDGVLVFLDNSLKRFDFVYPACGSSNSAVKLSIEELEKHSNFVSWIDVCKNWNESV